MPVETQLYRKTSSTSESHLLQRANRRGFIQHYQPQKFCNEIEAGIKEMFRVLKPGRFCAILVGDTRKVQHYVPLSYFVMQKFLQNGFILKEEIIKGQHNCTFSKRWGTRAKEYKFYLIMHEHLFVFRKPAQNEDLSRLRWSMIPAGADSIIK